MRNFPIAVRAWAAVQARTLASLPVEAVYRIGMDRARQAAARLPSKRLRAIGYGALARAMSSLDRKEEIRLVWQGRSGMRDLALINIVVVLHQSQKYHAAKWWAARPVRNAVTRRLLNDMVIEILLKENDLDGAVRFSRDPGVCVILRARTDLRYRFGEVTLRLMTRRSHRCGRNLWACRDPICAGCCAWSSVRPTRLSSSTARAPTPYSTFRHVSSQRGNIASW